MARIVPMHVHCRWMGHSSMETTRAYYLGSDERDVDTARKAMEALWSGSSYAQFARNAEVGEIEVA